MSLLESFGLKRKHPDSSGATAQGTDAGPKPKALRTDGIHLGPLLKNHENPYNHNAAHVVTIRILLGVCGLSFAINIIEGVSIVEMLPLHTVEPFLVTFSDHADQMVQIDPPTGHVSSMQIIAEQEIRDYIKSRYTVSANVDETVDRWNTHVRLFSTPKVFDAFQLEVADVKALITSDQFTRQVSIVNILNTEPGLYDIDFDTYEHLGGNGLSNAQDQTHHYTASMQIAMHPGTVPRAMLDLNPFGFVVTQYTVSPRQTGDSGGASASDSGAPDNTP